MLCVSRNTIIILLWTEVDADSVVSIILWIKVNMETPHFLLLCCCCLCHFKKIFFLFFSSSINGMQLFWREFANLLPSQKVFLIFK